MGLRAEQEAKAWQKERRANAAPYETFGRFVRHDRPNFWDMVHKTKSCWLWKGSVTLGISGGYGRFYVGPRREIRAHRLAYELTYGPIPDGLTIDHLCRVRHCVNPKHLEAVPIGVNVLRGMGRAARNARKQRCCRGHNLIGTNIYWTPKGRQCRRCRTAASRRWRLSHVSS